MINKELQGLYICETMKEYSLNGDVCLGKEKLFKECYNRNNSLNYNDFECDLSNQISCGNIYKEGNELYLEKMWKYEFFLGHQIKSLVEKNGENLLYVDGEKCFLDLWNSSLCDEQLLAIRMAIKHNLSIITGGAGTGKSTLIKGLAECFEKEEVVICAPTGKAARNLGAKVNADVRTVHSALGVRPDEDFLDQVEWEKIKIIIVDEASMITTEMFAGLVNVARDGCRIALIGDKNQLKAVGGGDIMRDLYELKVPYFTLIENHRQNSKAKALMGNVINFNNNYEVKNLLLDESFKIHQLSEIDAFNMIVEEASSLYLRGEDVQVITPLKDKGKLSVSSLNKAIKNKVNNSHLCIGVEIGGTTYHRGDRVMILRNYANKNCSNGDIGILSFKINDENIVDTISISMADGRIAKWEDVEDLKIVHAYALTIHKAQGSEYGTVLMPLSKDFNCMMNRNLMYTAISRAKNKIEFYGDKDVLNYALKTESKYRKTNLVERAR